MNVKDVLKRIGNPKILAGIGVFAVAATVLNHAGTTTVVEVNGVPLASADGQAFVSNGVTYVPLNAIAQKMGDDVTWIDSSNQSIIQERNGKVVTVEEGSSSASVNGQAIPLETKLMGKVVVPVDAKAIMKDSVLYVPIDFVKSFKGMGYGVKQTNQGGKTIINVAGMATQPAPSNPQTQKPGGGKTYPDGWTAPVLKSSWSSNQDKNFQVFQKELGFDFHGHWFNIPGQPQAISIADTHNSLGKYEVEFRYTGWQAPEVPASYRIPVVSKELFKFYFGKDYMKVWNYFNSGNIPNQFTANGRTVMVNLNDTDGCLYIHVGFQKKH
ncbi:copper amine oxidase N-terminal domain-containing protein (plasmid) [Aneurinibacillus sp. Ricciae_BoGa-3]|uniref:copper amine oxidase N-terminal domain-containing protein n=1 Tax=Aneurinibacillus sp. Ricciae_BoGa-3 TaxID=3022697 RepID=UPI002341A26F|nr:copper amine oxidase N-terminal domain-containing protein [Aneurinibacillus sp. Ricciae_BoGa-3]WCK57711.1 copper amine oxidase N-terminal domain-containing protein [Aneurinibacillus sp. Ricciae_BoGa-3]